MKWITHQTAGVGVQYVQTLAHRHRREIVLRDRLLLRFGLAGLPPHLVEKAVAGGAEKPGLLLGSGETAEFFQPLVGPAEGLLGQVLSGGLVAGEFEGVAGQRLKKGGVQLYEIHFCPPFRPGMHRRGSGREYQ